MNLLIKIFKTKTESQPESKTISNITDNFTNGKYKTLSNGELIQLIGYIDDCPYFLFSHNDSKFYLKFIKDVGFSIVEDSSKLFNVDINTGKIDRLPSLKKLIITTNLINNVDNINIFDLDGILKIGHINSVYYRNSEDNFCVSSKKIIECSEYLLIYQGSKSILCYSHVSGYSVLNKV